MTAVVLTLAGLATAAGLLWLAVGRALDAAVTWRR